MVSPSQFGLPSSSSDPIHPSSFVAAAEVSAASGSTSRSPLLHPSAAELLIHKHEGKQEAITQAETRSHVTTRGPKRFLSLGELGHSKLLRTLTWRSSNDSTNTSTRRSPLPSARDIENPIPVVNSNNQLPSPQVPTPSSNGNNHRSRYVPLYLAALKGDWESAAVIFKNDELAVGEKITEFEETALHIASGAKHTNFVQNCVMKMNAKQLRMKNNVENTALCFAAASGVPDIAKAMVHRDEELRAMVPNIVMKMKARQLRMKNILGNTTGIAKAMVDIDEELQAMVDIDEELQAMVDIDEELRAKLQNIVMKMKAKQLRMKNIVENSDLSFAGASGVTGIAKAVVESDEELRAMVDNDEELQEMADIDEELQAMVKIGEELLFVRGSEGTLPIYMAALLGNKDMVSYLYDKTKEKLNDDDCAGLLFASISSDLYDFAVKVLRERPGIAIPKVWQNDIVVKPQIKKNDETEPKSDAGQSQDVINNDVKQKHEEKNQTAFKRDGDKPESEKNSDAKQKDQENRPALRIDISQPQNVENNDAKLKDMENKTVFLIDISQPQHVKKNNAKPKDEENKTAFHVLARKQQAYESGNQLSYFDSLIYHYLCVDVFDNIMTPENSDKGKVSVKVKIFQVIISRVPYLQDIYNQKMMHTKVLKLLEHISKQTLSPDNPKIDNAILDLCPLLFKAAELGIVEFLVVLIRSYPDFFWKVNEDGYTIFHIAVTHRQEKVFSLIHEFGALKDHIVVLKDKDRNNMLHLAAIPPPRSRLKVDTGAALLLRKELLWFKEVQKIMQPSYKDMENKDRKTPQSLFTEKHGKLVKDAEEWMKGTSTSCMLVSTLIATVTFAALFTVPGGYNDVSGIPIFRSGIAFAFFAISDSASLICSAVSILTFLSILTSRCAEHDFVYSLPHRLFIGLIALFFSIATMMVAFGATLFIVLGHGLRWFTVFISVACFICVIWFTWLHRSLLLDIASDEYNSNKLFQTPMNLFEKRRKPLE